MLSNNQNQTTMNKLIIVIALFLFIPINVSADNIQEIYLTVEIVKPGHNGPIYRSPTRPIVATLNNAILTFKDLKERLYIQCILSRMSQIMFYPRILKGTIC